MATNPALAARTTLVAEEPWRAVLRCTLQAVAGAPGLVALHPLDREVELLPEWFKYPPI
jgi:methylmalonyl-CoA mutase N-terminal domain/subunit